MPTRTFTRKTDLDGKPADPTKGDPSFSEGILTALPGRTWRVKAAADVVVDIDGADLTPTEDADLTQAHTDWTPGTNYRYDAVYEVQTSSMGKIQKIEWFEIDNGDGTFSGLAKDMVYTWSGQKIMSTTTTDYYKDGEVAGSPHTENYYTANGKPVKKVK